jgi:hypothetical protein
MRFVVIFEEGPEMAPVREAHEPAHLAYLEQHREEIRECPVGTLPIRERLNDPGVAAIRRLLQALTMPETGAA